eukprot:TRINITY_DN3285_c0_g1_i1.p1 TRINITY_DN3285_c0_g1~~TRINITY_DN3285_c0_g1_i1.p1  ORF type:complete len:109 (+),score=4.27 TRINITY_DN3285_c0_g1_i1:388-714(+)
MGLVLNEANSQLLDLVTADLPANFPRCGDFTNVPRFIPNTITITSLSGESQSLGPLDSQFNYEVSFPFSTSQVKIEVQGSFFGFTAVINGAANGNDVGLIMGSNAVII